MTNHPAERSESGRSPAGSRIGGRAAPLELHRRRSMRRLGRAPYVAVCRQHTWTFDCGAHHLAAAASLGIPAVVSAHLPDVTCPLQDADLARRIALHAACIPGRAACRAGGRTGAPLRSCARSAPSPCRTRTSLRSRRGSRCSARTRAAWSRAPAGSRAAFVRNGVPRRALPLVRLGWGRGEGGERAGGRREVPQTW